MVFNYAKGVAEGCDTSFGKCVSLQGKDKEANEIISDILTCRECMIVTTDNSLVITG